MKKLNKEFVDIVDNIETRLYKPRTSTKNWETAAPSSDIRFRRKYKSFNEAWNAGVNPLSG